MPFVKCFLCLFFACQYAEDVVVDLTPPLHPVVCLTTGMGTGKVLHCCLLPLGLDKNGLVRSSNRQCSLLATWSTQDVTNTRPPSMKVVYTKDGTRDLRQHSTQTH